MEKQLKFEQLKTGQKVRFELAASRQGVVAEDEETGGKGTILQVTKHLVVIWNGKYRTTGTEVEMKQGRLKIFTGD